LTVIFAQDISCEKQDRILFEQINLHLNAGELMLLRGENGAGKTSLLRILVGLSRPQSGQVHINGYDAHTDTNQASQQLIYFGHKLGVSALLNPIENLNFWCQQHQLTVSQEQIIKVLEELGLEGLESLPVKNLSAGQQRRVSLARLWLSKYAKNHADAGVHSANHANLWVLDEPMTALDVNMVANFEAHIASFLKGGGCVLMTSHQTVNIDHPSKEFELEYRW
jgi:heme exporter protein A